MTVLETFFAVGVTDMRRATDFDVRALRATVTYGSPGWSSLRIAGVRIGLYPRDESSGGSAGLHFVVRDFASASAEIERAGGRVVVPAREVAPGVVILDAMDTEGNTLTLRRE